MCSAYLIDARVNVGRLLQHNDWRMRSAALNRVRWGIGATDEIDPSSSLLLHDADEDIRAEAALLSHPIRWTN